MRKSIIVCDNCGKQIEGKEEEFHIVFLLSKKMDLCNECKQKMEEYKNTIAEEENKLFSKQMSLLKEKLPKIHDDIVKERKINE